MRTAFVRNRAKYPYRGNQRKGVVYLPAEYIGVEVAILPIKEAQKFFKNFLKQRRKLSAIRELCRYEYPST